MEFKPLNVVERNRIKDALMGNAKEGRAINMSKKDTSFVAQDEVTDEEVITAIKSVPCHY